MLVRPKLLILTTLFDDPPLKIPCEISMDGISVSNLQGMYVLTVFKYFLFIYLFYFR